jgi:hypothetical protein
VGALEKQDTADAMAGLWVQEWYALLSHGQRYVAGQTPVGYAVVPSSSPVLGGASHLTLTLYPASRKLVSRVRVCRVLRRGGERLRLCGIWRSI